MPAHTPQLNPHRVTFDENALGAMVDEVNAKADGRVSISKLRFVSKSAQPPTRHLRSPRGLGITECT